MKAEEKILCVDDEANILFAYRRQLRKMFRIDTALGGEEGLKAIQANGPYAVVISDLKMPGMDGIQFLSAVRERSPDSVRMMITGFADLEVAMAAVNEGNIFRFLTKPVDNDQLVRAIEAAIEQYRLVVAERELLEKTLNGSIRVLTEILSLVNPLAFSKAFRLRRYADYVMQKLGIKDTWQYDLAAMLSHIGCISLDNETLEKVYAAQELSEDEKRAYASHPETGSRLIQNIPRLGTVALMIANQMTPASEIQRRVDLGEEVIFGSKLLRVVIEFDRLITSGDNVASAIHKLRGKPDEFDQDIVSALTGIDIGPGETKVMTLKVQDMATGMILDQDVRSREGVLLVAKGQEVTISVLERLRRLSQRGDVEEPIRVLVPSLEFDNTGEGSEEGTILNV